MADPPANDDCVNADDAGTLTSGIPVQMDGTTLDATEDCVEFWVPEVWIKFTITSCMDVTIDYCDDENDVMESSSVLFDGCPCDDPFSSNEWHGCASNSNPARTWYDLNPGTYYYAILETEEDDKGAPYTINITGVNCPGVPENDDCYDAEEFFGEVTEWPFTTRNATYDGSGSCIEEGPNVWFVYTPSFTGNAGISLSDLGYDAIIAVYDGDDCSPLPTELGCTEEAELEFAVVSGQQYLIEIGGQEGDWGNGTITLGEIADVPFNDDCSNADNGGTLQAGVTVQFTGSLVNATLECDLLYTDAEVWIEFTVPACMDITIDYCDDENSDLEAAHHLHTDCSCEEYINSNLNDFCDNDNPSISWYNIQAGTYYYPVIATEEVETYTVNVTGVNCPVPPEPDFEITAPYTGSNTTCGADNDCYLLGDGEDHIYEIEIPNDGNWVFSLCNSSQEWESYLYLGSSICQDDLGANEYACDNDHAE